MRQPTKAIHNALVRYITKYYGKRCPDYAEGCACCRVWVRFDIFMQEIDPDHYREDV